MAWPFPRRAALATLRAQLHLPPDERILIKVTGSEGDSVVATVRAIYWHPPGAAWVRLGWEEIVKVEEDPTRQQLVFTSLSGGVTRRATLRRPSSGRLMALAQERIAATRIVITRVVIDGRELWIEGRRQPATGRLHWFVRAMNAADLDDPRVIDRAVAEMRATLGLDGYL
jgi:hypothetical protein